MEGNSWYWIIQFLGRIHPLVVHFPIGILFIAIFLESLTIGNKRQGLREGINWIVYLGAIFALFSAVFGWILSVNEDYSGELIEYHQITGIATAALGLLTAVLLWLANKQKLNSLLGYRITLSLSVITLSIAGHLGAKITHGEEFLSDVLPWNFQVYDNGNTLALLGELNSLDSLSESQQTQLNLEVRAIFAHNCYKCHNENKQKGELVLDSKRGVFKGGESGAIISPGKPDESELFIRISLSENHEDVMPNKGKLLHKDEISLIGLWIRNGAYWSDRALDVFPEAPLALSKPILPSGTKENHPLDKLLHVYFDENNLDIPALVDDKTFIRRSYLDIIGLLPEYDKVIEFQNDKNPLKREILVDELLSDDTNYTQHWLSFWNDLLRNDYSGTGFITGGRKQITDWLYQSLMNNKPYDQMVKELVNPKEESEGFIKGIEWRGVVNASQRTEMQAAQNIGQSLMGVNLKCASCHNSFVSNLTLEQSYGFATIFADTVLELNRCDQPLGKMATANFIYRELGSVEAETIKERLLLLSEVMVKPENGRLYRTITNRIWKRFMGRGIVEPVDEMDNTPWSSDLLDWLAADFISSGYDLKFLMKTIMTSKAYQLPTSHYSNIAELKADDYVFEGPILRRLSAEQFVDGVSQIISPMYYAMAYDPSMESLPSNRIWHRELRFERDVLPAPGKRYFRHELVLPDKEIREAKVLLSVDDSYHLFLNGKHISEGNDWRKTDQIQVGKFLKKGKNIIGIEGLNEGILAKPAGLLFAMKIVFEDGEELLEYSGRNWKSSAAFEEDWLEMNYKDEGWANAKDFGSGHWDKLVNFRFEKSDVDFARASLVKQHPFLSALGRPSRENVTTSRDDQATLLQALELSNGVFLNNVLEEGAVAWKKKYNNNPQIIISELYQSFFNREPMASEMQVMEELLGEQVDTEALQDFFWAALILPEFQFIY